MRLANPSRRGRVRRDGSARGGRRRDTGDHRPALAGVRRPLRPEPGATAIYLHTAGTTGVPKRVSLSEKVLDARAALLRRLIGIGPDDRYATGSPLHHIGGLGNVLVALTAGASHLYRQIFLGLVAQPEAPRRHPCLLVPTMIEMLLSEGLLDEVPLKTLIYGASPISVDTLRRVLDVCPPSRWSASTAKPRAARSPA